MSDVSAVPGQKVPAEAVADPAALLNGSLQSLGLRLASGAQVTDEGVQGDFEGTLFGLLPCRGRILGGAPGGAEGLRAEVHLTGGTAD
ncbi:MAG TPA: hypothetical protein VFQ45_10995, partial [Longimicrobium sp.]|nr:hypothetical protein [Longimicrobium sp.]